jgi:glycosyltransferase involved in cell wall biosynthesis
MKVLLVHNFYQSSAPSGEDKVFKNELELLRKSGLEVIVYTKNNDSITGYGKLDRLYLALKNIWSLETYREIKTLIKKERPDIAHFHNIWYLISPSAYYACKDMGVPVVQTLHNFRIYCANGLLFRDEKICEECITKPIKRFKSIKNAFKYRCYRNSIGYSLSIALTEYFHWIKKTWIDVIDAYIALTEFSKNKYIDGGLPAYKIFLKPNFISNPPEPNYFHEDYACFIGRITQEKGLDIIIKAFTLLKSRQIKLMIVGDGALKKQIEQIIKKQKINNIELLGIKKHKDTIQILKNAMFLILPSICYETFPLVLIESFASGKPVIASRLGAMAELIEDKKTGLLFEPGNSNDLLKQINWMLENKDLLIQMGKNARIEFETKYTEEKNISTLLQIYKTVI